MPGRNDASITTSVLPLPEGEGWGEGIAPRSTATAVHPARPTVAIAMDALPVAGRSAMDRPMAAKRAAVQALSPVAPRRQAASVTAGPTPSPACDAQPVRLAGARRVLRATVPVRHGRDARRSTAAKVRR